MDTFILKVIECDPVSSDEVGLDVWLQTHYDFVHSHVGISGVTEAE